VRERRIDVPAFASAAKCPENFPWRWAASRTRAAAARTAGWSVVAWPIEEARSLGPTKSMSGGWEGWC